MTPGLRRSSPQRWRWHREELHSCSRKQRHGMAESCTAGRERRALGYFHMKTGCVAALSEFPALVWMILEWAWGGVRERGRRRSLHLASYLVAFILTKMAPRVQSAPGPISVTLRTIERDLCGLRAISTVSFYTVNWVTQNRKFMHCFSVCQGAIARCNKISQ